MLYTSNPSAALRPTLTVTTIAIATISQELTSKRNMWLST
jgi:hypothetical protein